MRFPTLISLLLPFTLTLAAPAPSSLADRHLQARFDATSWSISNLTMFIPSNPNTTSSFAFFYFTDTSPNNSIALHCVCTSKVFSDSYSMCGPKADLLFKMDQDKMTLRRTMGTPGQRITGIATQGTNWKGGEDGNVSSVDKGKIYTQTDQLPFTLDSVVG